MSGISFPQLVAADRTELVRRLGVKTEPRDQKEWDNMLSSIVLPRKTWASTPEEPDVARLVEAILEYSKWLCRQNHFRDLSDHINAYSTVTLRFFPSRDAGDQAMVCSGVGA